MYVNTYFCPLIEQESLEKQMSPNSKSSSKETFQKLISAEVERIGVDKFAQRYNVSKSTIRRWISGKSKPVKGLEEIIRLDIKRQREAYE